MSEDKEIISELASRKPKAKEEQTLYFTAEQLRDLVSAAVSTAVEKSAEVMAKAIMESRKPYISDEQKANDAAMRESMKEQRKRLDAQIKESQDTCQHLQGSNPLSDFPSPHGLTSIVQHKLDTGEFIGICTNCLRIFRHDDEDYRHWMMKKSGNRPSMSGQRYFFNPLETIRAGR